MVRILKVVLIKVLEIFCDKVIELVELFVVKVVNEWIILIIVLSNFIKVFKVVIVLMIGRFCFIIGSLSVVVFFSFFWMVSSFWFFEREDLFFIFLYFCSVEVIMFVIELCCLL